MHEGGGCTQSAGNGSRSHSTRELDQQVCACLHTASSPWLHARLGLAARSHSSAHRSQATLFYAARPETTSRHCRQPRVRVRSPTSLKAERREEGWLDVLKEAGEKEGQSGLFTFFHFKEMT
jgi:hypothetical protein